jgi:hypothetical protein
VPIEYQSGKPSSFERGTLNSKKNSSAVTAQTIPTMTRF